MRLLVTQALTLNGRELPPDFTGNGIIASSRQAACLPASFRVRLKRQTGFQDSIPLKKSFNARQLLLEFGQQHCQRSGIDGLARLLYRSA